MKKLVKFFLCFLFIFTVVIASNLLSQATITYRAKILIPLYSYPTPSHLKTYFWPEVARAGRKIPIIAIIHPQHPPNVPIPNGDYVQGIKDLKKGRITVIGYVNTNDGNRSIQDIKKELDVYAKFYAINGIFLDEVTKSSEKIDYYQALEKYIKSQAKFKLLILKNSKQVDEGFLEKSSGNIVVTFVDFGKNWQLPLPFSLHKYQANLFSCMIHSVADVDTMKKYIDLAAVRKFGYIYITDDSPNNPDKNPWNHLPSYWQEEINYLQGINSKGVATRLFSKNT